MCDRLVLVEQTVAAVHTFLQLLARAGEVSLAHHRTLHQRAALGKNRLLLQEEGGDDDRGGVRVHDVLRNPLDLRVERV